MKYQGNVRTVYDPSLGSFAIFETEDDAQRLAHANNQSGSSAEFKAVWDEDEPWIETPRMPTPLCPECYRP